MPLIKIDDREIEAPAGETILRVALHNGISIPYYCYHPALSIVGQCRVCLVEVQGAPKLLTACSTTIPNLPPERKIDGKFDMVVRTKNEAVKEAQKSVLEFLLLNHPLDCPVCDQAGECQLQEYSYEYGAPASRMSFEKLHAPKRVDMGPHVVYDAERCIQCTRCVRFCGEITGTGELTMAERGAHVIVETFPGRVLDNPYSGCTADICPVGALTSKEFRFKERVWFLNSANSVCPECSRGCSVRMDAYKGEILRIVPRDNPLVNGPWMCDYGRLLSERLGEAELVARPRIRHGEGWTARGWDSFSNILVDRTRVFEGVGDDVAFLLSGRMTLEEMAAARRLSEGVLDSAPGVAVNVAWGEDDDLLIRRERRPNLKGAEMMGIPVAAENAEISALLEGKRFAVIVREDVVGDAKGKERKLLEKLLAAMDLVIVADYAFTPTAALADIFIPLAGWQEMEGTTVNFQGILQKTARAVVPPKHRKPFHDVVSLWLLALGRQTAVPGFLSWFSEVKVLLSSLEGTAIRDLLPHGVRLEEVTP